MAPFGNELLIRLTLRSFCILTVCSFSYFPFWICGRVAEVPGHCILVIRLNDGYITVVFVPGSLLRSKKKKKWQTRIRSR